MKHRKFNGLIKERKNLFKKRKVEIRERNHKLNKRKYIIKERNPIFK